MYAKMIVNLDEYGVFIVSKRGKTKRKKIKIHYCNSKLR